MSDHSQVTRRAGIVGFFTFLSRITGLIRDAVIAFFFGTSLAADAFYMAFTIPNLLRRFVAEGAFTISFIPIFTKELKRSKEGAKVLADQSFTYLFFFLILLTFAGIYLAPQIVGLIASGFQADPDKFALTVQLTKICFPYILLVSLAAWVMGVLNSLKEFGIPAASPIVLNVGLIAGCLASFEFDPPIIGLCVGVLGGGAGQIFVQLFDLKRLGFFPRIRFGIHPELKSLLGLMVPAAYGAAVYQLNVVILRFFASFLPTGAVSYLWYGTRIFEFPMGVFTLAFATALQPTLSDHAAEEDWEKFKNSLAHGLRLTLFITIPAMVGMMVLAEPLTRVLLQRGAFDPMAAKATAETIQAFAIGLPFLGMVRLLVPAYYSLRDSKTPLYFATLAVVVNLVLAYFLVGPLQHLGLALAVSIASIANAKGLWLWLSWRHKINIFKELFPVTIVSLFISVLMGFCLWWPMKSWGWLLGGSLWVQGGQLLLSVGGGVLFYFGAAALFKMEESREIFLSFVPKLVQRFKR